jgi:aminopeptidase N
MMTKFRKCLIIASLFLTGCSGPNDKLFDEGVSHELAIFRKNMIDSLVYNLHFEIPEEKTTGITASARISFSLSQKEMVILDFKPEYEGSGIIGKLEVNGVSIDPDFKNEHIIISKKYLRRGNNVLKFDFRAGEQSLNRREDLLYTLLVPDRARTLFPCFDQPDLKAGYNLSLTIPLGWNAVANGGLFKSDTLDNSRVNIKYNLTDPIPTYLFSFVVGKLNIMRAEKDGRVINSYHQESDIEKISQWKEISDQIFHSLEWMEEYTGIKYPFEKYDIAIIPGFQYGGMEHTGATLYSDRTMFLEKEATLNERMDRAKLIAHETAHMWFGDYVTMPWFDDVWTKEVFANWFASQIVSPLYPDVDHRVNFVNAYYPASYAEDRTSGANPVQQRLDNLKNAGLVYGNIIYNKAPIVMEKLVVKVGYNNFRKGIKEYLDTYAYSNASWNQLIEILDKLSDEDLKKWSSVWIEERGRPHIRVVRENGNILYRQYDPFERGLVWEQDINSDTIINSDGIGYGLFLLTKDEAREQFNKIKSGAVSSDITRLSMIINLYENMEEGYLGAHEFMVNACDLLIIEKNPLIFSRLLGYISASAQKYLLPVEVEKCLMDVLVQDPDRQRKMQALRVLAEISVSPEITRYIFEMWENPDNQKLVTLGERDLMRLSYELAVRDTGQWQYIYRKQYLRLKSDLRRGEFKFIYPATSPLSTVRDSVFNSLKNAQNRGVEPWTSASLALLNHHLRRDEAVKYITPSLEILEEIQKTGDIFFPKDWLRSLLGSHNSSVARDMVASFLNDNPELNPMLVSKIRQQSNHLYRNEKDYRAN